MDREQRPNDDERDDDDIAEGVVAADDTGLIRNEMEIVHAEIEEAEEGR